MRNINMDLMYFEHLYKKGIIKKDTYNKIIRDITEEKNKLVTIKSVYNNEYVSVEGELNELIAGEKDLELSDRFVLINIGGGNAILQTQEGFYIRVDDEDNRVYANEFNIKNATIFTLIPINEKEVALKTDKGNYVKVGEEERLIADESMQNEKTVFKIKEVVEIIYNDIVMISLSEERFVSAINGGGSYLAATEFDQSENEEFTLFQFLGGESILKTSQGYYVRVRDDLVLVADTKNIEEASRFSGEQIGDDVIIVKTLDGNLVRVRELDKYLIADAKEITESCKFNIYQSTRPI